MASARNREFGGALVEFMALGFLLMLPLLYLIFSLGQLQASALASASIASAQATAISQGRDGGAAELSGTLAADFGLPVGSVSSAHSCTPSCSPGGTVHVKVTVDVPVLFSGGRASAMTVSSEATMPIERFEERP